MKSPPLRDILAVGAIVAGLFVMYVISTNATSRALAPASASSVDQSNSDDSNQQSPLAPFVLSAQDDSTLAPDFTLTDMNGNIIKLSDAVKRGPVVLDFWATWCNPCMYELPHMSGIYDTYKSRGVQVYAINSDRSLPQLRRFFRNDGPDCPILLDSGQIVAKEYDVSSLPTLCIIDRQMRLRSRFEGADLFTESDLGSSLDKLLKGA